MPRPRYQMAEQDVPVVHRWVQRKLRGTTSVWDAAAHTAWNQDIHAQPTATALQQWCDQYLDGPQWMQLQAVIRAARRDASQTQTVRLSTSAYVRLHDLATREQRTLSATIERHLAPVMATSSPQATPSHARAHERTEERARGRGTTETPQCLCHDEEGSVLPHGQKRSRTLDPHAHVPRYD